MIKLEMTGMCKGCPHADLRVECMYVDGIVYEYAVVCNHEPACRRASAEKENES